MNFLIPLSNALPGAVAQGIVWGIMAIGVYITYRILDVADLTVDGSLATGGAMCVMLMRSGCNPWLALMCAFLVGLLAGMVTGLLHTRCGIPAILSGILTQLALYSVNLRSMGSKANQPISVDKYNLIVSQRFARELSLRNPLVPAIVTLVVLIAILYWFFGTEYGSALGVDTRVAVTIGLMLSNGLVALAGALLAQYQGATDVNMGRGAIVIGLAAVIIGEVLLGKLVHNFALKLGTVVVGAVVYYMVLQVVLQLGLNTNDLKLFTALIVALFLSIPYWKGNAFRKKAANTAGGVKNA